MENLVTNKNFWHDRSVFLTGNTGFKGGWMAFWLMYLGARVHGYSLNAPTTPSFSSETKLEKHINNYTNGDIRDLESLTRSMQLAKPSIVFHMAAQPLVRESYTMPVDTYSTNVIGTVNLLEAVRHTESVEAVVIITTDKCYKNKEWIWPYRENDALGGHDPYSSSKACAEIVTDSYRNSFLKRDGKKIATVRAGNVIGGGDWAVDRLIPDFIRAIDSGETLHIRSPKAIRPWQHVLDPLSGYLILAEKLVNDGAEFAEAWNFGPEESDAKPVSWVIDKLSEKFPKSRYVVDSSPQFHEANLLKLDINKSRSRLGWSPRWNLEIAMNKTVEWYKAWLAGLDMAEITLKHIVNYYEKAE